jgi:hypothetical protein
MKKALPVTDTSSWYSFTKCIFHKMQILKEKTSERNVVGS